jgi:Flp pilus assembly protein TadD
MGFLAAGQYRRQASKARHLQSAMEAYRRGAFDSAEAAYRKLLREQPSHFDATHLLGVVLFQRGEFEESEVLLRRAVALDPHAAFVYSNLGNAVYGLGRLDEALTIYDRAIALDGSLSDAWNNRANVLDDLGRCDEALDGFDRAIKLKPDYFDAVINRAELLGRLGRLEDSLIAFNVALALQPQDPKALNGKAIILKSLKRIGEACDTHRMVLDMEPDSAEAHNNLGMTLLLKGDLAAGWPEVEHRWLTQENSGKQPELASPPWRGESLKGRSIVVYAEQGLGDTVQFCRYLPLLRQHGAAVSVLVPGKMHVILRDAFPDIELLAQPSEVESRPFDFNCAMMSLPLHFKTTSANIPSAVPYLKPDSRKVSLWRERIGLDGFKIGINWQGNPNGAVDIGRSIPLRAFAPLASIPGVRLISLQKNDGLEQLEGSAGGLKIETLGLDFDSGPSAFVDTLAAVESIDLIVTSDTSIAHIAGAAARPVWVALKHVPDWRWMLDRDDCPWYPTMRLFRQAARNDWSSVFARMHDELSVHQTGLKMTGHFGGKSEQ